MSGLPLLLSLADDLNRLTLGGSPFYETPFYYARNPAYLALTNDSDQSKQLRTRDGHSAGPVSIIGKNGFQVCMDVQQFKPSELNVKVKDNCVIVEGKHEEREDNHGYIARHFVRRYALPKGYDPNKVVSTLSSDGVLTVSVPKPKEEDEANERHIQIQQVGPAHLNVKENAKDKEEEEGDNTQAKLVKNQQGSTMSLVPLLSELEALSDVDQLLEDTFGGGIHPMDIFGPYSRSLVLRAPRRRYNPYLMSKLQRSGRGKLDDLQKSEMQLAQVGKDGFQVCMDVSQFTPNELTVKTVDRTVVVEGKHEEREDEHGYIQRHFVRKYILPKGYDPKDVVSTISSDGVLTVKAPPPPNKGKNVNERVVQIQQTGPAHLSVKQPEETKTQENTTEKMETK
ncbi:uncharacterized protein ACRADG_002283 [Cochliomyia hominivorax]